ncbi:hypothetical protein [Candidatus Poriferisodalis sp.]|uniref:hypothetical protein n=1 Tax=Candidatus Poriferisodalis sp. TaxID=3101277 RepID=UPI003B59D76A
MLMELMQLFDSVGIAGTLSSDAHTTAHADGVLDAEVDDMRVRFAVEVQSRAPYPGETRRLEPQRDRLATVGVPLLVAPLITESTGRALTEAQWSWADTHGNADVRARGIRISRRIPSRSVRKQRRGLPTGSGSWSIIRSLISEGVVEGETKFAERAGVSQPRVSQVLSALLAAELVERQGRSRWAADRPALLDALLRDYAGARGFTSWFYSLDPPQQTCDRIVAAAESLRADAVISGDVAADRLVPWRVPTHSTVYAGDHRLAAHLEMIPAQGPDDANVELIVPADTSVLRIRHDGDPTLAHPTQVILDLQRLGGTDRHEAAEGIREWLLAR